VTGTDDVDREALAALVDHLAATAERPVERAASRWLGEAEAVAADARAIDDPDVVRDRVGEVVDLLADTGDEAADEHVRRAQALAADLVDGTDGEN
jgi:nucleotide-binding universal stress UspA family protein